MKYKLIYCYDAYCMWCYGFSNNFKKIYEKYKDHFDIEVISGGMVISEDNIPIETIAPFMLDLYPQVESHTGIKFGHEFLWHIKNTDKSDWFPSSLKPAIALSIVKDINYSISVHFALDLEYSLFEEGRDLTDDEAYRHLLEKYSIDVDEFYNKLYDEEYLNKALGDFEICKQLQVKGFPSILLQVGIDKFYLMNSGYIDFETIDERFQNIIAEINN